MTAKLCIIGDSHIGALKVAWPAIEADFNDVNVDFFGGIAVEMEDLGVSGGRLVATSDTLKRSLARTGGATEIADGYDGYVLCGLDCRAPRIMPLFRQYRTEGEPRGPRAPISDECCLEAAIGMLRDALWARTAGKVRKISSAPMLVIPAPMRPPLDEAAAAPSSRRDAVVAKFFADACARLAAEFDAQFLPQPASTLASPLVTDAVYALEPVGLVRPHEGPNRSHMNAAYGESVLRALLETALPPAA